MQLKPQDFLVALKLVAWGEQRWTYARLAQELGISEDAVKARLYRTRERIRAQWKGANEQ